MLALMFKLCMFSPFNGTSTMCNEDQNSHLACTSQLQQRHKKGGGSNAVPQPNMEVEVMRSRSRSGLKCLLFDARMRTNHDMKAEEEFKKELERIDPNMGLSQMACEKIW